MPDELAEWAHSASREMDPEWADFNAGKFWPLAAQYPELAARAADRFVRRFLHEAELSERRYHEALDMLTLEGGTTPSGGSLLRVTFPFMGTTTTQEWDGTDEEADAFFEQLAVTLAEDAVADRSMSGSTGWEAEFDGD